MRRPLTDFRIIRQKFTFNGNDLLAYLIEVKAPSGRWYPASARSFACENDAIKYVKEELR